MTWNEQSSTGNFWKPEKKGDALVGRVVDIIDRKDDFGIQYELEPLSEAGDGKFEPINDVDNIMTPSHRVLQNRMRKAKIGTIVKIIFVGEEPSKGKGKNDMKMYDVFFAN